MSKRLYFSTLIKKNVIYVSLFLQVWINFFNSVHIKNFYREKQKKISVETTNTVAQSCGSRRCRSNTLTLSGTKTETRLRNLKSIAENFRARTKGAQSSGACMHTDQSPFSRNFHDWERVTTRTFYGGAVYLILVARLLELIEKVSWPQILECSFY